MDGNPGNLGGSILVAGVGGGGGNAVSTMRRAGMDGVRYLVLNTDRQALEHHPEGDRLALGGQMTRGLGAGADPDVGRRAAEESADEITRRVGGIDLVLIAAGMGGGTGTGAAPVVARLAKQAGALVVAIVTRPFRFEGGRRTRQAAAGLDALVREVDSLVVIANDRLLATSDANTTILEAFARADGVLLEASRGISELVQHTGYVNADFADLRAVLSNTGRALLGTGRGTGPERAIEAAQHAISSPLLEGVALDGARGVLVNFHGGPSMSLHEVARAMTYIEERAHPEANVIFGSVVSPDAGDAVRVTLVATGFDPPARAEEPPRAQRPRPLLFREPQYAAAARTAREPAYDRDREDPPLVASRRPGDGRFPRP